MLSTTTANRTCCIIDSERQQTGSRSFILWACASLIAKSMTSLSVSPVTAPCGTCHSWVDQLYHQLRMLKSLFKDTEHQTLTTSIIAKTLISMPPVTQELFLDTLTALKSCLSTRPVSVATRECSFSALRRLKHIFDRQWCRRLTHCALLHVHSDRVDSFYFCQCTKNLCWKMRKEQKSLAIPTVYSATVDIKEIRITKSVLVLQDSTVNWLNCWALFRWRLCVKFLWLWLNWW